MSISLKYDIKRKKYKAYSAYLNVKREVLHTISLEDGIKVLVAEDSDTENFTVRIYEQRVILHPF